MSKILNECNALAVNYNGRLTSKQKSSSSNRGWQRLANGIHAVVWRARVPKGSIESNNQPLELPLDPLHDLENWVAIKVVHERCLPPHDIQREVAVLRRISHKNVRHFIVLIHHLLTYLDR